jgi:2-aminoethylphosphonate transport system substrate-binding protein
MLAQKQQQEVSTPDWNDIAENLTSYVEDWKSATGS